MNVKDKEMGEYRIGARIHDLVRGDAKELAESIKDSGVQVVQLTLPKFEAGGEPKDGFSLKRLSEIKSAFDLAGVEIRVLSCYINPLAEDIEKEQATFRRFVDYAKIMGVQTVATETGTLVDDLKSYKRNHTDEAFAKMTDNLRSVIEYANSQGICVGVESVAYFPVCSAQRYERFKSAFPHNYICAVFDPTNLLCAENHFRYRAIFEEFVQMHARDIRVVHLKDFALQNGELIDKPLFGGQMDVAFLMGLLKQYEVCADLIIEGAASVENYKEIAKKLKSVIGGTIQWKLDKELIKGTLPLTTAQEYAKSY